MQLWFHNFQQLVLGKGGCVLMVWLRNATRWLIHPNLLFDREAATATKVARNLRPTTREKLK